MKPNELASWLLLSTLLTSSLPVSAQPVFLPDTGHYYAYFSTPMTWALPGVTA